MEKKTDLRVKKTKNAIINAFITLRARKPLSKITVRELSDLAMINKATFYLHYKDIYDLSDSLENDILEDILKNMPAPDLFSSNAQQFTKDLFQSFRSQGQLCRILFSDDRFDIYVKKIDAAVKAYTYQTYPEKKNDLKTDILLSMCTYGAFYAFQNHAQNDTAEVVDIISSASAALSSLLDES